MKAAIYARFSSTLQDERSVDDQVRICREKAEKEGWEVVDVFADYAISGAVRERPGLNAMLARLGEFDVVIAEALDRISRHQADIATIYETLKFNACQLVTLSEGSISEIHIGFTGTMAALFRTNLADKIRRGQRGRVAAGRIPGGICYGYRKVIRVDSAGEPVRGLREIDHEQADVILRVFHERLAGQSGRAIVQRLNADGIPGPTGRGWTVSMVNGDGIRGNGILRNEIYIGRLVYNRTRMVRDPVSRRRVPRVNPRAEWVRQEVPELRIVPQELWDRVHADLVQREGWAFHQQQRPKRLLSGLVQCGVCGANYIVVGKDLWGCSAQRQKGTCDNGRKITTAALESRVLDGLQTRLLDPELVKLFVRRFHKHLAAAEAEQSRNRGKLERQLETVKVRVARMVAIVTDGGSEFEEFREALQSAKAERQAIEAELADLDAEKIIPLMPNIGEEYQRAVNRLSEALSGSADARVDAVPALRSLIESIRLLPRATGRGVDIELTGRLASIIALSTGKKLDAQPLTMPMRAVAGGGSTRPMIKAVAEDCYALDHRLARVVL